MAALWPVALLNRTFQNKNGKLNRKAAATTLNGIHCFVLSLSFPAKESHAICVVERERHPRRFEEELP